MVRLDRTGFAAPAGWSQKALQALPAAFAALAQSFEALGLDDPMRRVGFRTFAPQALLVIRGKPDFPALWRKDKSCKTEMAKISSDHCAYCQSPAGADQTCQVEHVQPKSLFPLLAYEWSNYLLSCERCNLTKSDKWPRGGLCYVRPDVGDPAPRFVFREDGKVAAAAGDLEAQQTIDDFGLNRKGLVKFRRLVIEIALKPVRVAMADGMLTAESRRRAIEAQMPPDLSPWSAAVNQNVRRVAGLL